MKKILIFTFLFCFYLCSCNDSSSKQPKGDTEEIDEEKTTDTNDSSDDVESSSHLLFKGIPIDGTLDDFIEKLKRKGFESIASEDGVALLRGDFATYNSCIICVFSLEDKDLVSKIAVVFPEKDRWSSLYGNYTDLKQLLTEKYGEPSSVIEEFQNSYIIDDDQDRMFAVWDDRCKYESIFSTDKGVIDLFISHGDYTNCFVVLNYLDKINGGIVKDVAIDDL